MSTVKYWVWLSSLTGIRPKTKSALLAQFGSPEAVYFAEGNDYRETEGITSAEISVLAEKDLSAALMIIDGCGADGIDILTMQDAGYPVRLRNIFDPPAILYVKGKLPVIDEEAAVGVAGTRKSTVYGNKMAKKFGYEIAKSGGLVISGLAEGIDSLAATGALEAGGRCVGVLGTAVDIVFPRFNKKLFEDVAATGAVVSEYPPKSSVPGWSFPARNRIISGLSLGVLIVEAPEKSGALITAAAALDQGRDVFAVPANADSTAGLGSNRLITEGARAVLNGSEVMSEYAEMFPHRVRPLSACDRMTGAAAGDTDKDAAVKRSGKTEREKGDGFAALRVPSSKKAAAEEEKKPDERADLAMQLENLTESQLRIVSVMSVCSMHADDITELCGLPVHEVLSELTMLQINGFVNQEKGKRFTLNITAGK